METRVWVAALAASATGTTAIKPAIPMTTPASVLRIDRVPSLLKARRPDGSASKASAALSTRTFDGHKIFAVQDSPKTSTDIQTVR
ncbi:hypothetical protein GCM10010411_66510 [Actinomadura fulvescens]|uniref:Secreted protein n=1 Tax=Actinomadura fulvescens TaxID=46160 RepID=A0ABP6CQK9_9ACTN